jgi:hypothetical protein
MSDLNTCDDCGSTELEQEILLVAADLGEGAFLTILCVLCWHRRQYLAKLKARLPRR